MFGWKSKAEKERELEERVARLVEKREMERIEKEEAQAKAQAKAAEEKLKKEAELLEAAAKLEENRHKELMESDTPWVNVVSCGVDTDGNIRMKLDWNPAFVQYLKNECGFTGDAEHIVQKWIGALYREIYSDGKNDALNLLTSAGYDNPNEVENNV